MLLLIVPQMQNIFLINLKRVFVAEDCYFLFVRLQMCAVVLRKHRSRDRPEFAIGRSLPALKIKSKQYRQTS